MSKNPDLLCKYVKQLAIETHPQLDTRDTHQNYKILKSLEVCFRLYKRDHRFQIASGVNDKSEWLKKNFQLSLKNFKTEINLSRFLFLYGKLYFVNINFL